MNNVLAFNRNAEEQNEFVAVLTELLATARRGEMKAFMHFTEAGGVNRIGVVGAFKDRLQYTLYTLVKGLNVVTDQIAEAGSAGYTTAADCKIDERQVVEGLPARLRRFSKG